MAKFQTAITLIPLLRATPDSRLALPPSVLNDSGHREAICLSAALFLSTSGI